MILIPFLLILFHYSIDYYHLITGLFLLIIIYLILKYCFFQFHINLIFNLVKKFIILFFLINSKIPFITSLKFLWNHFTAFHFILFIFLITINANLNLPESSLYPLSPKSNFYY